MTGGIDFSAQVLSNLAILYTSYIAVSIVNTCGLLSVIIVAVFFSQVNDRMLKIGPEKLIIGLVSCIGIIIFNYYTEEL